jgi:large subunit ribosomal protein L15
MNLTDAKKSGLPRKYKFIKGRGHSSGVGKTCGRGRKGQYSRTGTSFRPYFEGGQMSMLRRLPKFGFNNKYFQTDYEVVNVSQLETHFEAGATVDRAALKAAGLVRRECDGVKILGSGTLTKKLAVKAEGFAKSAEEKIVKAGGTAEKLVKVHAAAIKHHASAAEHKSGKAGAKASPSAKAPGDKPSGKGAPKKP